MNGEREHSKFAIQHFLPWTFTPPDIAAASSARRTHAAAEAGRADAGRRRQRARSDGRDGGDDRRRLSAHEPHRRRRLLAGARAVGPRARADGGGPRRREARRPTSIASMATTTIPPRGPLAALTVPGAIARLDAGARGRQGASAARCRSTCCSAHAIRHAREGYAVTRSQARLTAEKLAELQGRAGLRRDVPGRRQAAGGRRDAEAAGARRDARSARACRARRFLSRRCRARDRRRPRTHRQPGDARRSRSAVTRRVAEPLSVDARRPARSTTRRRRRRASPR